MHWHTDSSVLAVILGLSLILSAVDIVKQSVDQPLDAKIKYKPADQLSVHAYQTDVSHSISMAGPFLSKIRVTPNATRILTATAELNTATETYCGKLPTQAQAKCNMRRLAAMYFGDIHSSWSVLGTQSTYTLVKHIFCILLAFSLFWMSEHMIYTYNDGWFRKFHKQVRVAVLILAIIIFAANVGFDIQPDMYKVDTVAIGSITTGISFYLVCMLIICFTHLHDPDSAVVAEKSEPAASSELQSLVPGAVENGGLGPVGAPGIFNFSLWSAVAPTVRTTDADRYRRFEDMYLNIHVSYLVLLLTPLFLILALAAGKQVVVDVHVQLFFFSSIFFAVLDVFQTRVTSVLASLTQTDQMSVSTPLGMVKGFVVLAFILCKLLVCVPSWQLLLKYYALSDSVSYYLVVWQIVLFGFASAVDLMYILDFYNPASSKSEAELAKAYPHTRSPEKMHVLGRQLSLGFYLVASSITVLYV